MRSRSSQVEPAVLGLGVGLDGARLSVSCVTIIRSFASSFVR